MVVIQPIFYPDEMVWGARLTVKSHQFVAPTIPELLAKIRKARPGIEIEVADYYPIRRKI